MRVTTKHVGLSVDANVISCDSARHTGSTQSDMAEVSADDRWACLLLGYCKAVRQNQRGQILTEMVAVSRRL